MKFRLEHEFGKDSWPWKRYGSANVCCFVGIDHNTDQEIDPGDDLLFWRLYGNDCRGVSIVIASHMSKSLVESSLIQRVIYTDKSKMQVDISAMSGLLDNLVDLRRRARSAGEWDKICSLVIPACDQLFGQRFLWKHTHYEMESEYRAVTFLTEGEDVAPEDSMYSCRGQHVQYGLIRTYVQIPKLSCGSIFTTGSQITLGNNVPNPEEAKGAVTCLVENLGTAPGVVGTRISQILYRPR